MARGKVKADHRADNRGGPWAGLPHVVIDSPAYRDLSLWARAILIELVREMNGYNNGAIGLSQRQIGDRVGTTNYRRIGPAIAELMDHGFIDISVEGAWKQRLARQYRLTFVNTGAPGHYRKATNEYLLWTHDPKKSGDATVATEKPVPAATVATDDTIAAATVATGGNGKLPKTPLVSADTVASLISKPYREELSDPCFTPENASGPDQDTLRKVALAAIRAGGRDAQGRLASAAGIAEPTLSTFLNQRVDLPPASAARLARELNGWRAAA